MSAGPVGVIIELQRFPRVLRWVRRNSAAPPSTKKRRAGCPARHVVYFDCGTWGSVGAAGAGDAGGGPCNWSSTPPLDGADGPGAVGLAGVCRMLVGLRS